VSEKTFMGLPAKLKLGPTQGKEQKQRNKGYSPTPKQSQALFHDHTFTYQWLGVVGGVDLGRR